MRCTDNHDMSWIASRNMRARHTCHLLQQPYVRETERYDQCDCKSLRFKRQHHAEGCSACLRAAQQRRDHRSETSRDTRVNARPRKINVMGAWGCVPLEFHNIDPTIPIDNRHCTSQFRSMTATTSRVKILIPPNPATHVITHAIVYKAILSPPCLMLDA